MFIPSEGNLKYTLSEIEKLRLTVIDNSKT